MTVSLRTPLEFVLCLVVLLAVTASVSHAQLDRVTDPSNPVVTDAFESGGGFWVDVNGDGYLDLFVANGNLTSQNNSLYLNDGAGGFRRVSTGAIVNDGGSSIGSTWGDFDRDGKVDVFVTNRNNFGNFLYRGNGDSTFTKVVAGSPVTDIANSNSSSWVDVDRDGNLDLYVVNFQGNDYYYHNDGPPSYGFTRIDTLLQVGDGANFSISGTWGDYDNDRKADLFVGNAGTQSDNLYHNAGSNVFTKTVLADGKASVGNSWGDYDNDGAIDLFVANTLGQNNVLYHNSGAPGYTLTSVSSSPVTTDGGNSVGSAWGDVDNDGDLDLFVGNDGGDNFLYLNDGPPSYTFTRVLAGDAVTDGGNTFGVSWGDYDNDGALDLFVANRLNQLNFLYHNAGNANHWLELRCTGVASNPSAIGAKVRVKAAIGGSPRWQLREIEGQTGYNSGNLDLHVGLGDAVTADSLLVEWPSGATDIYRNVRSDRRMLLVEGLPPAPAGLTVTPSHETLSVRWEKSPADDCDHYVVFMDTLPGAASAVAQTANAADTSVVLSGLVDGKTYYLRVRAVDQDSLAGAYSLEVTGIPMPVVTLDVAVEGRWNIVSLPVLTASASAAALFPSAASAAFSFSSVGGYAAADTLRTGAGYWVKFSSPGSVPVTGEYLLADTGIVSAGWNLVGSISAPVPVSTILSDPPAMGTSAFFRYHLGYQEADTILPGRGYWVKADIEGFLILASGGAAHASSRVRIHLTGEGPPDPPRDEPAAGVNRPVATGLQQNYPNPFNPGTTILYQLEKAGFVRLAVYDILGRLVATLVAGEEPAGVHQARFDAGRLAGGIYYSVLEAGGARSSRKMLLSK
jgi:hypothetical protein